MTKIKDSGATIVEKFKNLSAVKAGSLEVELKRLGIYDDDSKLLDDVEESLKSLNLKEKVDDSKLVERGPGSGPGPTRVKEEKVKKAQPYDPVQVNPQICNCLNLDNCSICLNNWTRIINTSDFDQFVYKCCQNLLNKPEIPPEKESTAVHQNAERVLINQIMYENIAPQSAKLNEKPQKRRESHDSGFLSDVSSPESPSKIEAITRHYRKVYPKPTTTTSESDPNKTNLEMKTAQEILKSTLNEEFKRKKHNEAIVNPHVFSINEHGLTILHTVLQKSEPYMEETFYGLVEKMKRNPSKCQQIVDLQNSIIEEMENVSHDTSLLRNYFCEAIELIQTKLKK